jgi:hypothetical protein
LTPFRLTDLPLLLRQTSRNPGHQAREKLWRQETVVDAPVLYQRALFLPFFVMAGLDPAIQILLENP